MSNQPLVAVVMGSRSDWDTMKASTFILKNLSIPYHAQVISAHRTPDLLQDFAKNATAHGFKCIIAGAPKMCDFFRDTKGRWWYRVVG
jgi:5-(carboxyamino)imidazole ribonucleotide mutase